MPYPRLSSAVDGAMDGALEDAIGPSLQLITDVHHNCATTHGQPELNERRASPLTSARDGRSQYPVSSGIEHLQSLYITMLAEESEALAARKDGGATGKHGRGRERRCRGLSDVSVRRQAYIKGLANRCASRFQAL